MATTRVPFKNLLSANTDTRIGAVIDSALVALIERTRVAGGAYTLYKEKTEISHDVWMHDIAVTLSEEFKERLNLHRQPGYFGNNESRVPFITSLSGLPLMLEGEDTLTEFDDMNDLSSDEIETVARNRYVKDLRYVGIAMGNIRLSGNNKTPLHLGEGLVINSPLVSLKIPMDNGPLRAWTRVALWVPSPRRSSLAEDTTAPIAAPLTLREINSEEIGVIMEQCIARYMEMRKKRTAAKKTRSTLTRGMRRRTAPPSSATSIATGQTWCTQSSLSGLPFS